MAEESVILTYDPFSLPTAQHRAGLAGLLFLIDSMKRRKISPTPTVNWSNDGRCELIMTPSTLTSLFNDLYDASTEETERKSPLKNKAGQIISPKREVMKKDDNGKEKKVYIYDQVIPRVQFLRADNMPDTWIKLWCDCVWETLRGIPTTRNPYKDRAAGKDVKEASAVWKALSEKSKSSSDFASEEVPSCLFIGSQAASAEKVPFYGRADENVLLHFWPVVMQPYIPEIMKRDGNTKDEGFVIAVPDVVAVRDFVTEYKNSVASLDKTVEGFRPRDAKISVPQEDNIKPSKKRSRPRDAKISVPQEGALEYAMALVRAKEAPDKKEIAWNISGVDIFHIAKRKNNIRISATDHVTLSSAILEKYEAVRQRYNHPLFRRQIILNLLRGAPWHAGFDKLFAANPYGHFVFESGGERHTSAARFARDAKKKFEPR